MCLDTLDMIEGRYEWQKREMSVRSWDCGIKRERHNIVWTKQTRVRHEKNTKDIEWYI